DEVVGFSQTFPDSTEGTLMLKYQPYLYVVDGCVPFPAVDAEGDTSAGLAPTGDPSGDCSSSTGQVYARAAAYNGAYAIMYSWYFPKDEPSEAEALVGVGHRYDWEGIVVWLSEVSTDASLLGVAASYHGDYTTETDPDTSDDHPLIKYYSAYDILDHSCGFTDTVGGMQPLIAWDSMPTVSQEALADKDWGDANVPFIDANFDTNLEEAEL
ncbi:NPP1-domain-containing protein, partial [Teratosphaeria nubilosa]